MPDAAASLVLPLGSNPSPLFSLAWALAAERVNIGEAWLITSPRGHGYLERALDAEWDRLRDQRGRAVPPRGALHLVTAGDDLGSSRATAALGEAVWQAFAQAARKDAPVICGLGGGRHRSIASLVTTIFSFLARTNDRLVDVRYGRKELEATTAFLYPGQRKQTLSLEGAKKVEAASVEVRADDIPVARLRRLLTRADRPVSFLNAVALGQRTLDALALPEVTFDLDVPRLTIDGNVVKLSASEFVLLAGHALARLEPGDDGWSYVDTLDPVHRALARVRKKPWVQAISSNIIKAALFDETPAVKGDAWRQLRLRAAKALARAGKRFAPVHAPQLVLERRRMGNEFQCRLRLPPGTLRVVGG